MTRIEKKRGGGATAEQTKHRTKQKEEHKTLTSYNKTRGRQSPVHLSSNAEMGEGDYSSFCSAAGGACSAAASSFGAAVFSTNISHEQTAKKWGTEVGLWGKHGVMGMCLSLFHSRLSRLPCLKSRESGCLGAIAMLSAENLQACE